jgi:Rrf2 family protein
LLVSQKGPTGGFALALPSEKITLFHIVEAIDGSGFTHHCVMGFSECSGKHPCAIHHRWATVREELHSILMSESIAEMAKAMRKPEFKM